jgi:hypothetical protein
MRVLKESFNAGEFTPRLWSRYELAKYKNGCKDLTNFVPLPHGPVTRRPGSEYITAVKTASAYTRLIPFEFSEADSYMLELGPLYCRFYRNGGQIQTVDADTLLLLHCDGINNSTTITDSGATDHSANITANGNAKLKTSNKKFGSASCNFGGATTDFISVADHADWFVDADDATVDFWVYFNTLPAASQGLWDQYEDADNYVAMHTLQAAGVHNAIAFVLRDTATFRINKSFSYAAGFNTGQWYHIALIKGWGSDSDVYAVTVNGAVLDTETYAGSWINYGAALRIGRNQAVSFDGEVDEFRFTNGTARWTTDFAPPSAQYPFGDDSGTAYEIITTYDEVSLPDLHFVQSADTMYIVHKDFVVRKLVRSDHDSWAISNVSFTNAPSEWSAGDYPRTVNFYEDRLVFGGSPDQPDTIWTSDSSDYTAFTDPVSITAATLAFVDSGPDTITDSGDGFIAAGFTAGLIITVTGSTANNGTYTIGNVTVGTLTLIASDTVTAEGASATITIKGGSTDDDKAITLTLLARKVNDIQWLSSGRKLQIGTRGEEWWAAGPSDTEPITPTDHVARRDSAWGSEHTMPVDIGDVLFFVQQGGKSIREMTYDFSKDKYVSADLNILAEHLTRTYSLSDMAYQQQPYQVLWCIRSDGTLLSLTYLKEQEVFGWAKHSLGNGVVESVATIPGDPEDEVWMVVRRTVNSATVRYVERMKTFNYGTSLEDAFFMDSGLTYNGAAITAVSGLSHLEGEAVQVLADGLVVTGLTVSSGAITLTTAASKIHIGLLNTPEFETLDAVTQDDDGTLQGILKRITNVSIRLVTSQGGLYGPDSSTTDSIPYRDTTTPFTGWTDDLSFDEQDDLTATVYLTCDEPLPFEIAAILIDLEDE